jgi:hypothetical protein
VTYKEQEEYDQSVEHCIKAEMQTLYPEEYERIYGSSKTKDEIIKNLEKENSELKQKVLEIETDLFYCHQTITQLYSQISKWQGDYK